jgi:hypothetical protein
MTSINGRSQSLHAEAQQITAVIHTTLEHYQNVVTSPFKDDDPCAFLC